MEQNQEEFPFRMGQRNVYCYDCKKLDNYMINLNDVKCKYCGSTAVQFTKKAPDEKEAKSIEETKV